MCIWIVVVFWSLTSRYQYSKNFSFGEMNTSNTLSHIYLIYQKVLTVAVPSIIPESNLLLCMANLSGSPKCFSRIEHPSVWQWAVCFWGYPLFVFYLQCVCSIVMKGFFFWCWLTLMCWVDSQGLYIKFPRTQHNIYLHLVFHHSDHVFIQTTP